MEDHAALRAIVRPDTGEGYREMLTRMAQESGIETPTAEDLIRLDRQRRGKTLSNEEWVSAHARTRGSRACPDARIARMPGRADRAHARTRGSRACPDARIARMPGRADRAHARTRGSRACPNTPLIWTPGRWWPLRGTRLTKATPPRSPAPWTRRIA